MYVRIKSRPNTQKKAVQIVKSYREGVKVRQKIVQTVGYAFDEETLEKIVKVANHLRIEMEINENPTLFPPEELIEASVNAWDNKDKKKQLLVDLSNLREEKTVITGFHQIYGKIYDQIGFKKAITKSSSHYLDIIKEIVLARLANPSSKRESVSYLNKDFSIDLDLNKVYRAMDRLDDHTISKIQKIGFESIKNIVGKDIKVAFYDCTTLYFESFKSDELKDIGYSKDCKFNQPQVLLSLFITEEGLPLGYDVFPGNTFEGHTLIKGLEKLKKEYGLKEITVVSDSGLLSEENIKELKSKGYSYILGARLKNLELEKQAEILEGIENSQENKNNEYTSKSYSTSYKEEERLIVRRNNKRAKKDKLDREKQVEKLREKLNKSSSAKSLISNYGYKKYLDYKEVRGKIEVNEEKLKSEEKWDGLSGVITNIKEKDKKNEEILGYYRELWQIEDCFRVQKNDLKIRPIYHWNPRRVKSHINICYQAFSCQQYLKYRLRLQGCNISGREIQKSLIRVKQTILKEVDSEKRYAIPSKLNEFASVIYKIMRQKYNNIPYEIDK